MALSNHVILGARRASPPQYFTRPFFSSQFIYGCSPWTKQKRDYSLSVYYQMIASLITNYTCKSDSSIYTVVNINCTDHSTYTTLNWGGGGGDGGTRELTLDANEIEHVLKCRFLKVSQLLLSPIVFCRPLYVCTHDIHCKI